MKSIHDIRRDNLRRLIDKRFGGSQTQFAKAVGLKQPSFVSRLLTDREPTRKNIGNRLARRVEIALHLAPNFLDTPDRRFPEKPLAVRDYGSDRVIPPRAASVEGTNTNRMRAGPARTEDHETSVALLDAVQLGQFDAISEVYEVVQPAAMITVHSDADPSHALALRLPDDAMGERFPEGSIAVISDIRPPQPNDFVVAVLPSTATAVMRQWAEVAGRHFLVPLNRAYPATEVTPACRVLGVVIEAVLFIPVPPSSSA